MKTVAVVYGWAEGAWQSRRFIESLNRAGFKITDNVENADIIFAHSAGCFLVPKTAKAKLIVLAGLPYWPGRNIVSGVIRKLINELRYHRRNKGLGWWANKMMHNGWYILTKPQKTYFLLTRHKTGNLPAGDNPKVVLLRASDDTMLHPQTMKLLPEAQRYQFVELDGAHDDCWLEPKAYVDLLLKEL